MILPDLPDLTEDPENEKPPVDPLPELLRKAPWFSDFLGSLRERAGISIVSVFRLTPDSACWGIQAHHPRLKEPLEIFGPISELRPLARALVWEAERLLTEPCKNRKAAI